MPSDPSRRRAAKRHRGGHSIPCYENKTMPHNQTNNTSTVTRRNGKTRPSDHAQKWGNLWSGLRLI